MKRCFCIIYSDKFENRKDGSRYDLFYRSAAYVSRSQGRTDDYFYVFSGRPAAFKSAAARFNSSCSGIRSGMAGTMPSARYLLSA